MRGVKAVVLSRYFNAARDDTRHYTTLRDAPAAVLIFLAAAARARLVAADLWDGTANRKIERHLAGAIAIPGNCGHRANRLKLSATGRSICRWRSRSMFAQQKLRQGGQKILKCLQIRGAAKQIV